MRQAPTPERYHEVNHPWGVPFADCRRCQKNRAICRSKIRFTTLTEAQEWVDELNRSEGYAQPVCRYWCHWCEGWHMTTARSGYRRNRAERQRRKWLIEREMARRATG